MLIVPIESEHVCVMALRCSPLAASTEQQQHGHQQQDSEGAEGEDQDQLLTAEPRRHPGGSGRPRPDHARLWPPPHSTQHRSHDASHCWRRGHRTGTCWGKEREEIRKQDLVISNKNPLENMDI